MEENKAKTTETAERASSGGTDAGAATSKGAAQTASDSLNESAFEDAPASGSDKGDRSEEGVREKQTTEQNRENARRRREAEREALIRRTREQTIIEALDGQNPYTGEEMKDSHDVEEYLAMKEISKSGGDPVADYPKYRKNRDRDVAKTEEERAKREEWYRNDREAFVTKHPDVNLNELINDQRFRAFARGKTGEVPMSEIYEEFVDLVGEYEENAKKMAAQMLANRKASPGALSTSQSAESDYFTPEQVKKMSPTEVKANYDKIRSSMTKWK